MIHNLILSRIAWSHLKRFNNKTLNYIYVDTLAREHVLQHKVEPDRSYSLTSDYKLCFLPCSYLDTIHDLKLEKENPLFHSCSPSILRHNDLCQITGINYYGLVEQYKKNICVIDMDTLYK